MIAAAAVVAGKASAGEQNDEYNDYPKAAVVVTKTKAHIVLPFSAHKIFITAISAARRRGAFS